MYSISKKICPFVQNPSCNCYCFKMGSQDIEKAIYFCSRNFEMCDLYRSRYVGRNVTLTVEHI